LLPKANGLCPQRLNLFPEFLPVAAFRFRQPAQGLSRHSAAYLAGVVSPTIIASRAALKEFVGVGLSSGHVEDDLVRLTCGTVARSYGENWMGGKFFPHALGLKAAYATTVTVSGSDVQPL
jgi:hypothetical protein